MDIETKLKRFSEVVQMEAEEVRAKRLALIEQKHETGVSEFRKKTESKYKEMLEDAEVSAEKQKQKAIAQKSAETKKALIQERAGYINGLFENVSARLSEFFASPDYEKLIVESVAKAAAGAEDVSEMKVVLMERDKRIAERITEATGVLVTLTDEDFLGGVKIRLGKNKVADYTLKRRYEQEKSGFNKIRIN